MVQEVTSFINGHIFTGETEQKFVNSLICQDGRILKVGNNLTPSGKIVDLHDATVLPGLAD